MDAGFMTTLQKAAAAGRKLQQIGCIPGFPCGPTVRPVAQAQRTGEVAPKVDADTRPRLPNIVIPPFQCSGTFFLYACGTSPPEES
jgi:hypothetical protein